MISPVSVKLKSYKAHYGFPHPPIINRYVKSEKEALCEHPGKQARQNPENQGFTSKALLPKLYFQSFTSKALPRKLWKMNTFELA